MYFSNKICFEDFSAQIQSGDRTAIVGNNDSGKSTLLKIIKGDIKPSSSKNIVFRYVPQLILEYDDLSSGEKFSKSLSSAFFATTRYSAFG
ncbi:MAG: ATP-binding cassette domain-containing protein [Endomicrobium sp.]|nr:ATP-binding cassette domain-containing protein [Endomicrobium sp.]